MAIERAERGTQVSPSGRLVREFRTDLPTMSDQGVQNLAGTMTRIGTQRAEEVAKREATKIAYGVELGRDAAGNYTVPQAPEDMGFYRREVFDTIVTERAMNESVMDLQQQLVEIRARHLDDPLGGIEVMRGAMDARLAALPPEMRGRLGPVYERELQSHAGDMLMRDAIDTQNQMIAGIESDNRRAMEAALDAFSLGTDASRAEGERILGEIGGRTETLIAMKKLPPQARDDLALLGNSMRTVGSVLGVIRSAHEEGNLTVEDLDDLEAIIRDPDFDEQVLGVSSEEIREGLATEEGRVALSQQVQRLRTAWARQQEVSKFRALYAQTMRNVAEGTGGFAVNTSPEDKFKIMQEWSADTGLGPVTPDGRWNLTPETVDLTWRTFGELPEQGVKEWFRDAAALQPDQLMQRLELFEYLQAVPDNKGGTIAKTEAIDPKDYHWMRQFQAAVRGGKPPETAAAIATAMFDRNRGTTTDADSTMGALVSRLREEKSDQYLGRANVEEEIAALFPSTGMFSQADWLAAAPEVRESLLLNIYQQMELAEGITFSEAAKHAATQFMAQHTVDQTQVGADRQPGALVPNEKAVPAVTAVGAGSGAVKTTDYVAPIVDGLFTLTREGDDGKTVPVIPRDQAFGTIDPASLRFGENVLLRAMPGHDRVPKFQVMVQDPNGFWFPVRDETGNPVSLDLSKAAAREDEMRRQADVVYARAKSARDAEVRKLWDPTQTADPTKMPALPEKKGSYAPIYYDEIIVRPDAMNRRGPLQLEPEGGTLRGLRPFRRDDGTEIDLSTTFDPGITGDAFAGLDDPEPAFDALGYAPTDQPTYVDPGSAKARLQPFGVDKRRRAAIPNIDDTFATRMAAMVDAMPADIRQGFGIRSSYRSDKEQARIFAAEVRRHGGNAKAARKWAAPPGKSYHNKGLAIDLQYGSADVRKWVHQNATRFGLYFPMKHEPWHIEPLGTRDGGAWAGDSVDPH